MDQTIKPSNRRFNVNSIQRQIQQLNPQNRIQCQVHSKTDPNMKTSYWIQCVQRQIQPLNHQIEFNVNSIQRQIQH